eukprot:INCI3593.1.p1 GENE.INCI3593.1~~INCI3593.1.p1  ORF type:complete len:407 (+),score=72.27 INCI3593.1:576-1796(+)
MPRPRTAPGDGDAPLRGLQIEAEGKVVAAEDEETQEKLEAHNTKGVNGDNRIVTEADLWKEWNARFRQHSQAVARDRDAYVEKPKKAPLRTSPVAKATSPRLRPSLQRYALRKSKTSGQKASSNTALSGQSGTRRLRPFVTLRGDSNSAEKNNTGSVMLSFKSARKKKKKLRRVSRGGTKNHSRSSSQVKTHKSIRAGSGSGLAKRWASAPSPFASSSTAGSIKKSSSKTGIRALLQRRRAAARKKQQRSQLAVSGASDSKTRDTATDLEFVDGATGQTSSGAAEIGDDTQSTSANDQRQTETAGDGHDSGNGNGVASAAGSESGTSSARESALSRAQKRAAQLRRQIGAEYVRRHKAKAKTFGGKGRKARGKRKGQTQHQGESASAGGSEKTVPQIYEDIMVFLT